MLTNRIDYDTFLHDNEVNWRGVFSIGYLMRQAEWTRWKGLDSTYGPVVVDIFKKVLNPLNTKFVIRAQKILFFKELIQSEHLVFSNTLSGFGNTSFSLCTEIYHVKNSKFQAYDKNISSTPDQRVLVGVIIAYGVLTTFDLKPIPFPEDFRKESLGNVQKPTFDLNDIPNPSKLEISSFSNSTQVYKRDFTIKPNELDSYQHLNQSRYLEYFDDVRVLAGKSTFFANQTNLDISRLCLHKASVEYFEQVVMDDPITILMKIAQVDKTTSGLWFDFHMISSKNQKLHSSAKILYLQNLNSSKL